MKVLYGVQATGNGHITRARAMAKHFLNASISVDFLFSGRDRDKFFDMEIFGEWQCLRGLTFIHDAGSLNVPKTLQHNSLTTIRKDIKQLDLTPYDLVVTDFEPITAWAAKKQGQMCIGIGHQYAFDHNVPKAGDNWLSRQIMQRFAPADRGLGLHWHHFGQPILPPIAEVHDSQLPVEKNKIVVYLGFENHDDIMQLLEPLDDHLFVVYGPYERYQSFDNIQLKPLSRDGFQRDLATAEGVICNAGFELASEAIQLGKKLLVKPLHGQMEQQSNAVALEQLRLGMSMKTLDVRTTRRWLNEFSSYQVSYPDVAKAIVEWLRKGDYEHPERLADKLWRQVFAENPTFAPLERDSIVDIIPTSSRRSHAA